MSGRTLNRRAGVASVMVVAVTVTIAGCGDDDAASGNTQHDARSVTVESTDDGCAVSATEVSGGDLRFEVTNRGSQVTEFYLYAEDGVDVVAEVENIGPGITRSLDVSLESGNYVTACKPGMTGEGIRADFVVGDSTPG